MRMTRTIQRYGWRPDLPDPRDRSYNLEEPISKANQLPAKFSLRDKMPKVFDQGQLGSCTANGIVGVLMAQGMKQGEAELMLSRLYVYYHERAIEGTVDSDSGAQIRDGIKVVATLGAPPESVWPYDIAKFTDDPPVKADVEAKKHEAIEYHRVDPRSAGAPLRSALFAGNPIVKGFAVPERFEDPDWNPKTEALGLPRPYEGFIGGHCTVTIGWDFTCTRFPVPVFEERNSWNARWGDEGHYWADARWLWSRELSSDFWVVRRVGSRAGQLQGTV